VGFDIPGRRELVRTAIRVRQLGSNRRASKSWNWSVSYIGMLAGCGGLHLFISHQRRQVLHLAMKERDLAKLPTRGELGKSIFSHDGRSLP
jgi:hypothetical protein